MVLRYQSIQKGLAHFWLAVIAGGLIAVAMTFTQGSDLFIGFICVAALLLIMGLGLSHLCITEGAHGLHVEFGPVKLFRTFLPYDEMERVELDTTRWYDGIGVSAVPFLYSSWNMKVGRCVRVTFKGRRGLLRVRAMKIGTNDASRLASIVADHIGQLHDVDAVKP